MRTLPPFFRMRGVFLYLDHIQTAALLRRFFSQIGAKKLGEFSEKLLLFRPKTGKFSSTVPYFFLLGLNWRFLLPLFVPRASHLFSLLRHSSAKTPPFVPKRHFSITFCQKKTRRSRTSYKHSLSLLLKPTSPSWRSPQRTLVVCAIGTSPPTNREVPSSLLPTTGLRRLRQWHHVRVRNQPKQEI